jgi:hypothetical protein
LNFSLQSSVFIFIGQICKEKMYEDTLSYPNHYRINIITLFSNRILNLELYLNNLGYYLPIPEFVTSKIMASCIAENLCNFLLLLLLLLLFDHLFKGCESFSFYAHSTRRSQLYELLKKSPPMWLDLEFNVWYIVIHVLNDIAYILCLPPLSLLRHILIALKRPVDNAIITNETAYILMQLRLSRSQQSLEERSPYQRSL